MTNKSICPTSGRVFVEINHNGVFVNLCRGLSFNFGSFLDSQSKFLQELVKVCVNVPLEQFMVFFEREVRGITTHRQNFAIFVLMAFRAMLEWDLC